MTRNDLNKSDILRKLSALFFIIFIANSVSCKKALPKADNPSINGTTEWWSPILQRHDITPAAFNNFEKVFEMGSTNSITNRIVTLDSAFILVKPEGDEYLIIKSLKAYHDLDSNIIKAENGSMDSYNLKSKEISPRQSISFDNLTYHVDTKKVTATNVNGRVNIK